MGHPFTASLSGSRVLPDGPGSSESEAADERRPIATVVVTDNPRINSGTQPPSLPRWVRKRPREPGCENGQRILLVGGQEVPG